MVKQKKLCISGLCRNDVTATYCKDWNPRYPSNTSECLQFPWIPLRYPPDIPKIPPRHLQGTQDINRRQQMTTDANRCQQTPSDTDRCCLSMSGGVCWRMLSFVDILSSLEMSGGCLGDVWVVSGGIWVVFMETRGTQTSFRSIWDSSPYRMELFEYVWYTALKPATFFAGPFWNNKISKCPYIRFTKIIGLWDFFVF